MWAFIPAPLLFGHVCTAIYHLDGLWQSNLPAVQTAPPRPPFSPGGCFAWTACLQGGCLHLRTYLHSIVPWMPWTWPDLQTRPVCWGRSSSGHVLPWPYCGASCFWRLTAHPKQHPAMSKSNIPFSWGWAPKKKKKCIKVLIHEENHPNLTQSSFTV